MIYVRIEQDIVMFLVYNVTYGSAEINLCSFVGILSIVDEENPRSDGRFGFPERT